MKNKITAADFRFLYSLASLKEALTISAVDPVVLSNPPIAKLAPKSVFASIFYDCYNDKEAARKIMAKRIASASDDLRHHYQIHKQILENFYTLEEAMNTNNRERVVDAAVNICKNTEDYALLVDKHGERLKSESFLKYPFCPPGHYFTMPFEQNIHQLRFNPGSSRSGCFSDLSHIEEVLADFKIGQNKIPPCNLSVSFDSGEGIIDSSLRGRLELNKILLQRAGFYLGE